MQQEIKVCFSRKYVYMRVYFQTFLKIKLKKKVSKLCTVTGIEVESFSFKNFNSSKLNIAISMYENR